jgi:hypothetical protein
MIPVPPKATSVSVSKSGTLAYDIYDANGARVELTITEVSIWGSLVDGYAKVRLKHANTSPKVGPAVAYQKGGTLTVTFS